MSLVSCKEASVFQQIKNLFIPEVGWKIIKIENGKVVPRWISYHRYDFDVYHEDTMGFHVFKTKEDALIHARPFNMAYEHITEQLYLVKVKYKGKYAEGFEQECDHKDNVIKLPCILAEKVKYLKNSVEKVTSNLGWIGTQSGITGRIK
ncbi:MAG: hypothetical protein DWQ19_09005 [Crenarchaeota archaeon]|nr:MAG: hypothetical protein DWQ19_09005 [Thermoproteota archaeon]